MKWHWRYSPTRDEWQCRRAPVSAQAKGGAWSISVNGTVVAQGKRHSDGAAVHSANRMLDRLWDALGLMLGQT